jgi:nicotinate-nucleotide adenylyltransferase
MIGIFGGTFDPVHNGHLRIALDALELLDLDQVRLIPLAQAVHREQPATPAALRLEMLLAATAGRPQLVVDERELARSGPSYTIDTLRSLRREFPARTLCLLLGADAFDGFAAWREPEGILELANLAILERPGGQGPADPAARAILERHRVARLEPHRSGQIVECPVTQLDIASSDIRTRLAAGRSVDFLLPDAVLAVIAAHRLYQTENDTV